MSSPSSQTGASISNGQKTYTTTLINGETVVLVQSKSTTISSTTTKSTSKSTALSTAKIAAAFTATTTVTSTALQTATSTLTSTSPALSTLPHNTDVAGSGPRSSGLYIGIICIVVLIVILVGALIASYAFRCKRKRKDYEVDDVAGVGYSPTNLANAHEMIPRRNVPNMTGAASGGEKPEIWYYGGPKVNNESNPAETPAAHQDVEAGVQVLPIPPSENLDERAVSQIEEKALPVVPKPQELKNSTPHSSEEQVSNPPVLLDRIEEIAEKEKLERIKKSRDLEEEPKTEIREASPKP